jgi:mannose-1-phosphate guanylyltransferase
MESRRWGVILAGGEGTRLKPLSRLIAGDNRPKQFCALFGATSLLARTRRRIAPAISPDRILFVVVKDHERFYLPELADVDGERIVVQPSNRGTTAAIVYSLLRLTRLDGDPTVAFFPADHHYADERQFTCSVNEAFDVVNRRPDLLVLLGAKAENPQVEYGWIEPGCRLDSGRKPAAFRVNRFWEKPTAQLARTLMGRGCLWNTFVLAGRALTFLEVLEATMPEGLKAFKPVAGALTKAEETERGSELYRALAAGDFSRDILTGCADKLAVLRMDAAGWDDLGTPEGVFAAMRRATLSSDQTRQEAFSEWLAAYGKRLDGLRRQAAVDEGTAERLC